LTRDLENPFSNAHSHDEYLCKVSLECLHKVQIVSREIDANGRVQRPAGRYKLTVIPQPEMCIWPVASLGEAVTSLRLVSPGAATDGYHPTFS